MIDWIGLLENVLWVMGLAVALAAVSYTDWKRRLEEPRLSFRQMLGQARFQVAFGLGMALFCAGLALSLDAWWQRIGWALLAAAFTWLAISSWRRLRRAGKDSRDGGDDRGGVE